MTVYALSTPPGRGAIAIIRITGSHTATTLEKLTGKPAPQPRQAALRVLSDPGTGDPIDSGLVLFFQAPHSYTSEDMAELHIHGGIAIVDRLLGVLSQLEGLRPAEPGEFTKLAFLNGKMDLSQAEAVADLISSDSESSHKIALQQMRGGFSSKIKELRDELIDFASLIELELDFSGEDVDFADFDQFEILLNRISDVLKHLIDSFSTGNVIKSGVPISIVGEPNVGKSTLLNTLLNDDRAIVSDIAGTTRDTIEDELIINGIKFRFIDTAGIRKTDNVIESIGIEKTYRKMADSQLILYMLDCDKLSYDNTDKSIVSVKKIIEINSNSRVIVVFNKIDLIQNTDIISLFSEFDLIKLSAKTGYGVDTLKNKLSDFVKLGKIKNNDTVITNARHYDALVNANNSINNVKNGLKNKLTGDLLAIDIRESIHHFGRITGEISTDDLLGNIFSNFCIGK